MWQGGAFGVGAVEECLGRKEVNGAGEGEEEVGVGGGASHFCVHFFEGMPIFKSGKLRLVLGRGFCRLSPYKPESAGDYGAHSYFCSDCRPIGGAAKHGYEKALLLDSELPSSDHVPSSGPRLSL